MQAVAGTPVMYPQQLPMRCITLSIIINYYSKHCRKNHHHSNLVMYSHGSSARIGVGKRGHGGRNYRPPPDRHNKGSGDLVPPPLKACDCLIQLDLPEYLQEAGIVASDIIGAADTTASSNRRRMHWCFPGDTLEERRQSVLRSEKQIRTKFGVHILIPGRLQRGPVTIAGTSYQDTIPATAWFLEKFVVSTRDTRTGSAIGEPGSFTGRIQRNVKDPNDVVLEGEWRRALPQEPSYEGKNGPVQLFQLFQSDTWTVMACNLMACSKYSSGDIKQSESMDFLEHLQTCVDNLKFRLGSSGLQEIDLFLRRLPAYENQSQHQRKQGEEWSMAFAAGHPSKMHVLVQEVAQVMI
jgi:hypothetical protein